MPNLNLLIERDIDKETALKIAELQHKRELLIIEMQFTDDMSIILDSFDELTKNEFNLQELWGFEKNEDYHFLIGKGNIPHCECPLQDNLESRNCGYRIYSENCPLHKQ